MIIINTPYFRLDYDPASKQLIQTWTGFAGSETFRKAIDDTVKFAQENPVRTILSDTTNQKVVKPDDSNYAASKMPDLFAAGLQAMAFVLPENVFTKMSLKGFSDTKKSDRIEFFPSVAEAKKWLSKY